jgi:aryl-alcohol dehydrogenase-like predicted oxidoreductase
MSLAKLSLGTAQFGFDYGISNRCGAVSDECLGKILSKAEDAGINMLDTAPEYGNAERRLGAYGMQKWKVGSKVPSLPGGDVFVRDLVLKSIERTLSHLQISQLDSYIVHRATDLLGDSGDFLFETLRQLKEEGTVEKIGASTYNVTEIESILNRYDLDLFQTPFNVFDQAMIRTPKLKTLKSKNTEVHARSVFLQGLLLLNESDRPKYFGKWDSLWRRYDQWLTDNEVSAFEANLSFVCNQQFDRMVVGVDSFEQFSQLLHVLTNLPVLNHSAERLHCADKTLTNPSLWNLSSIG